MRRKTPEERKAGALEVLALVAVAYVLGPAVFAIGLLIWAYWPF